jgi:hypothetical protein
LIPFVFSRVEAEFASFVRRAFYHKLPLAKIFRRPEYLQKKGRLKTKKPFLNKEAHLRQTFVSFSF